MRVLVVGSGAREHALVARLAQDPNVGRLAAAPGNPGIARLAHAVDIPAGDLDALEAFADQERIDLTVVGPELPLGLGIVDRFSERGLPIFGPSRAAARLETSKGFAKSFMERRRIPTARFQLAETVEDALRAVNGGDLGLPLVIKADGLAAGKGVVVAADRDEAVSAVHAAMSARKFGSAGDRLVIEECLRGPEVSFFVVSDGRRAIPIGSAQDHKRLLDDDRGPNTGGMGAIAPSPLVDRALEARIMREIVHPTIDGMAAEGHPFRGFLYVGLMLTAAGPQVIEFNVRLGDPEAQVLLPLIEDPLLPILAQAAAGDLRQSSIQMRPDCCAAVVLASAGYPEAPQTGRPISGVELAEAIDGVEVYHAGTQSRDGRVLTSGGRVLAVVGRGHRYADAVSRAYAAADLIRFDGVQYRRDIGRTVLVVEHEPTRSLPSS